MTTVTSFTYLFGQNEQRLTAAVDGFERGLTQVMKGLSSALIDTPN